MVKVNTGKNMYAEYDNDYNKLVTLDKYLDSEISKGPNADPGRIGYHYQHYDNVYNYFMIQYANSQIFNGLCIPHFKLRWNNYETRTAMAYNLETKELIYSPRMNRAVEKCFNRKRARFIYFTFVVIFSNKTELTHANIVIIDMDKMTIERFEPYGHGHRGYMKEIDNVFVKKVLPKMGLQNFKYIPPASISPALGIQAKADSYGGMCVTITMLYLHLRIMNPDISRKLVIKYLLDMNKKELKKVILKYARHVEKTLKKNKNFIYAIFNRITAEIESYDLYDDDTIPMKGME